MESSGRAPGYDLFKLVVAIILLVIFFLLNARTTSQPPTPISTLAAKPTSVPVSSTSLPLTSTTVPLPSPTATNAVVSTQAPLLSPTTTVASAETVTPLASLTAVSVSVPTITITPVPSPTVTNTPESTAAPLPSPSATPATSSPPPAVASACESATSRSRLQNGINATILRRLNFRSSPGIQNNWLLTNLPGTKVQVIGGPECVPHFSGAYVWWQVKLPDGQIGWSAEGSQFGSFYFMEPE